VPEMMTTREVADYLRVKERKIYDLIRQDAIPCARVSGKWLFPKALIDRWVLQSVQGGGVAAKPVPPVIAGSHDPLLDWAIRESGSALAFLSGGSLDGLQRVADGAAALCGAHMRDAETGTYNIPWVERILAGSDVVVIAWARRQQGLVVAPGNPLGIRIIADLARGPRVVRRQEGAGSRLLLEQLLAEEGCDPEALVYAEGIARTEADLGAMIVDGKADAGLAIGAAASMFRLDFMPLHEERFDLIVRRREFFEPPVQALLAFARSPAFEIRAGELGGYDVSSTGAVVWNGVSAP
jgi:putative molybdopterin biosynthesis protein